MKPSHFYPVVLILLSLVACNEEEVKPSEKATPDPFQGSWTYTNSAINLTVSFDAVKSVDGYIFQNIKIVYPDMAGQTGVVYGAEAYDPFADNAGFGEIRLHGANNDKWIFVNLIYNSVQQKAGSVSYEMIVKELVLTVINKEPVKLEYQKFTKVK